MSSFRRFANGLAAWTAGTIALLLALVILTLSVATAIRTIFPQPPQCCLEPKNTIEMIISWAHGGNRSRAPTEQPDLEWNAARLNDDAISGWIEQCTSKLLTDQAIYARVKAQFGENGVQYASTSNNTLTQDTVLPAAREIRLLSMSVGSGRANNALSAAHAYTTLQLSTWLAILLGLTTTVLVSLGATEFGKGDSQWARTIRILAIVFPALGTAAAAVTAFYAPREDLARSSQALASFRQIHEQMTNEIGPLECPASLSSPSGKQLALRVADWKKALKDARTVAESAALAAVDPARGQISAHSSGSQDGEKGR